MNERTKQLAEQAGRWCYDNYDIPTQERFQEKFAELIVREHLSLITDCYRGTDNAREWDNALLFLEKHIKEHFGVEE